MSLVNERSHIRRPRLRRDINHFSIAAQESIKHNDSETIIRLITNGFVSLNTTFDDGRSLLHMAVKEKKYNIVEVLINLGIDRLIVTRRYGFTAMHIACMNGFISIVRLMFSKGREDLGIIDRYGKTPLNYAIDYGNKPIAKFFIENGVDHSYLSANVINEITETREQSRRRELAIFQQRQLEELSRQRIHILRRPQILEIVEETKMEVSRPNKDIIDLIINNEIAKKSICPISMEEIEKETSVVTNCFHVFSKENLEIWLQTKKFCPVCKTKCFVL